MRVLVIGKFYIEAFALHIAETLEEMGHAVCRFEPGFRSGRMGGGLGHRLEQAYSMVHAASDSFPAVRASRMRKLWELAERTRPEAVIVCHDFLWPVEVAELKRRTGGVVALWFPDHLANFGRAFFMNANYDALFFKDPYIVHILKDVLVPPVYYLPECFNPRRHSLPKGQGEDDPAYRCEITTAGNIHSWRVALFRHLERYDVKLWGKAPPLWMQVPSVTRMYQGKAVYNEEKVRAFRGAKIVLNSLHFGEIWGVNVRAFEAAGAGAFQLLDWRPGLAQLFTENTEIVSFRGLDDLKRKLDRYLADDDSRRMIATAGMRRAFAEHTYEKRLSLLFDTMSGKEGGFPMLPSEARDR